MTMPLEPPAQRTAPIKSLIDVFTELETEISYWSPGCVFPLFEEAEAQRRSPPYVIWIPGSSDISRGLVAKKGPQRSFRADYQMVTAQVVGRPFPGEPDPRRSAFKGTERLRWAVLWAIHKFWHGAFQAGPPEYVAIKGLSTASVACNIPFVIGLALMRPDQKTAHPEALELDYELTFDLPIPTR